jgi:hypothetical protein
MAERGDSKIPTKWTTGRNISLFVDFSGTEVPLAISDIA